MLKTTCFLIFLFPLCYFSFSLIFLYLDLLISTLIFLYFSDISLFLWYFSISLIFLYFSDISIFLYSDLPISTLIFLYFSEISLFRFTYFHSDISLPPDTPALSLGAPEKGISFLQQTQIFWSLYLCNLML